MLSFSDCFELRLNECGIVRRARCRCRRRGHGLGSVDRNDRDDVRTDTDIGHPCKCDSSSVVECYEYDAELASHCIAPPPPALVSQLSGIRDALVRDQRFVVNPDGDTGALTNDSLPFKLPDAKSSTFYSTRAPFVRGLNPPPFTAAFTAALDAAKWKQRQFDKHSQREQKMRARRDRQWLLSLVTDVSLPHSGIATTTGLSDFTTLRSLTVANNALLSLQTLPPSLMTVNAAYNRITTVSLTSSLTVLDLSHNRLRSLAGVADATGLQSLDVGGNELTELSESVSSLSSLPSLKTLSLARNPLCVHPYYRACVLQQLTQLSELDGLSTARSDEELAWRQSLLAPAEEPTSMEPFKEEPVDAKKGAKLKSPKKKLTAAELAADAEAAAKVAREKEFERKKLDEKVQEWNFTVSESMWTQAATLAVHLGELIGLAQPVALQPDRTELAQSLMSPASKSKDKKPLASPQPPLTDVGAFQFEFASDTVVEGVKTVVKSTVIKRLSYRLRFRVCDSLVESECRVWSETLRFDCLSENTVTPSVQWRDFLVSSPGLRVELVQRTVTQVTTETRTPKTASVGDTSTDTSASTGKGKKTVAREPEDVTTEQSESQCDTVVAYTDVSLASLLEPKSAKRNAQVLKFASKWQLPTTLAGSSSVDSSTSAELMIADPLLPDVHALQSNGSMNVSVFFNCPVDETLTVTQASTVAGASCEASKPVE